MHVAHLNPQNERPKAKPVNADKVRRDRGLAEMKQRDLAKAIKEYSAEIAEIREVLPGWMPGQSIK
jgi:hypothetical protein